MESSTRIALTQIGRWQVFTVFLSDQECFETMVFGADGLERGRFHHESEIGALARHIQEVNHVIGAHNVTDYNANNL